MAIQAQPGDLVKLEPPPPHTNEQTPACTRNPPPPPPTHTQSGGGIQVVHSAPSLSTWAVASSHPGHPRQVARARKCSVCPGIPAATSVAHTDRGTSTPADRRHHLCHAAIKECGASQLDLESNPPRAISIIGRLGSLFL